MIRKLFKVIIGALLFFFAISEFAFFNTPFVVRAVMTFVGCYIIFLGIQNPD